MAAHPNVYRPKTTGIMIAAILLVMVVVLILVSTILIIFAGSSKPETTTSENKDNTPVVTTPAPKTTTADTTAPENPNVVKPTYIDMERTKINQGTLVLIDDMHLYSREGLVPRRELTDAKAAMLGFEELKTGEHYSVPQTGFYLDQTAKAAFDAMAADLGTAVGNNLQVRNAYYYNADIVEIVSQDDLETVEHSTGMVLDLQIYTDGKVYSLTYSSQRAYYNWLTENCWKYGYIWVRDTANYSTFRYVGIPHAAALRKLSVGISEYLTSLEAYTFPNHLPIYDANDGEWWIYYVKAETALVEIPVIGEESNYMISGDNKGGFVVAVNTSVFAH